MGHCCLARQLVAKGTPHGPLQRACAALNRSSAGFGPATFATRTRAASLKCSNAFLHQLRPSSQSSSTASFRHHHHHHHHHQHYHHNYHHHTPFRVEDSYATTPGSVRVLAFLQAGLGVASRQCKKLHCTSHFFPRREGGQPSTTKLQVTLGVGKGLRGLQGHKSPGG